MVVGVHKAEQGRVLHRTSRARRRDFGGFGHRRNSLHGTHDTAGSPWALVRATRLAWQIGWIRDRTLVSRMAGIETMRKHRRVGIGDVGVRLQTPTVTNTSTAMAANRSVTYVIE